MAFAPDYLLKLDMVLFHKTSHFFARCLCLLLILLSLSVTTAIANDKYASLVMDANTGVILHQSNADKMLHPASLTKVMTLLMLFDALDSGRLKLGDRIYISRHAASMVPSKLNLPPGSSIRVQDAIYALVTKSANDIAVAVAEKLGKTEQRFALMMNKKARSLGMNRTRFINASGLHHPKQVTTARDMAKMARYLISIQPRYYRYFSRKSFTYRGNTYKNHNHLLGEYDGMDGIKTGYIQASGFNLLASAKRGNTRLIGVVFGGRTSKSRNAHMRELLDAGFQKIQNVQNTKPMLPSPNPKRVAQTEPVVADAPPKASMSQLAQTLLEAKPRQIQHVSKPEPQAPPVAEQYKVTRSDVAQKTVEAHMQMLSFQTPPAHENTQAAEQEAALKDSLTPDQTQVLGTLKMHGLQKNSLSQPEQRWSIQIGAYSDRNATDLILQKAHKKLPGNLQYAYPFIAPFEGRGGWIYRAWLSGFSQQDAQAACVLYPDCLVVEPQTN